MNKVKNPLRVVHFPQAGSSKKFFSVEVKDEEQANLVYNVIADQHCFLFDNDFIPDYANDISVQMYDNSVDEETNETIGWTDYYNDDEAMEWDELVDTYLID